MPRISFQHLNVETISQASGIFSGTNVHVGFRSVKQQNAGSGTVVGNKNVLSNNHHVVQKQEEKQN
ncbi:MAG: hypothetical protein ACI35O_13475 [Bacillaceae bacterium]